MFDLAGSDIVQLQHIPSSGTTIDVAQILGLGFGLGRVLIILLLSHIFFFPFVFSLFSFPLPLICNTPIYSHYLLPLSPPIPYFFFYFFLFVFRRVILSASKSRSSALPVHPQQKRPLFSIINPSVYCSEHLASIIDSPQIILMSWAANRRLVRKPASLSVKRGK